jgi:hypothetical protein
MADRDGRKIAAHYDKMAASLIALDAEHKSTFAPKFQGPSVFTVHQLKPAGPALQTARAAQRIDRASGLVDRHEAELIANIAQGRPTRVPFKTPRDKAKDIQVTIRKGMLAVDPVGSAQLAHERLRLTYVARWLEAQIEFPLMLNLSVPGPR